ncbi:MAG: hypothetical protein AABX23_05045 [Nanoarchaeota archaeon]
MKLVSRFRFFFGIFIFILILFSYFLRFDIDNGSNYVVRDSLLGVIIFHSFFVLVLYLLIALFFVFTGLKRIKLI